MAPRYRTVGRDPLMILPHDLREWIPAGDIVHVIVEAAALVPLGKFKVIDRGTGEEKYHPQMMLALLLYCYSHGTFGRRRIERVTWKVVAVRYICGNLHPDHDTICDFRIRNQKAISEAFLQVLKLAKELGVLRVGTVSVDGTKIKASASILKSLRYDRAGQIEARLELEIADLLAKAKDRWVKRKPGKKGPDDPEDPPPVPEPEKQVNLTDDESHTMRKNNRSSYEQAYNAQAVVDADGTMLVLGVRVSDEGPDAGQLALDIEEVPRELGRVKTVLADTGYANGATVQKLQGQGLEVLVVLGCGHEASPGI